MLKSERVIRDTLLKMGRRHGVKIYRVANAGNHLHLLVRFTRRRALQNFLRGATGLIARKVLRRERGPGLETSEISLRMLPDKKDATGAASSSAKKLKFWSQRPFTRVVSWGRDFDGTLSYLQLNSLEALGFIDRKLTRALPTQEIRARVLDGLSRALESVDPSSIRRSLRTVQA